MNFFFKIKKSFLFLLFSNLTLTARKKANNGMMNGINPMMGMGRNNYGGSMLTSMLPMLMPKVPIDIEGSGEISTKKHCIFPLDMFNGSIKIHTKSNTIKISLFKIPNLFKNTKDMDELNQIKSIFLKKNKNSGNLQKDIFKKYAELKQRVDKYGLIDLFLTCMSIEEVKKINKNLQIKLFLSDGIDGSSISDGTSSLIIDTGNSFSKIGFVSDFNLNKVLFFSSLFMFKPHLLCCNKNIFAMAEIILLLKFDNKLFAIGGEVYTETKNIYIKKQKDCFDTNFCINFYTPIFINILEILHIEASPVFGKIDNDVDKDITFNKIQFLMKLSILKKFFFKIKGNYDFTKNNWSINNINSISFEVTFEFRISKDVVLVITVGSPDFKKAYSFNPFSNENEENNRFNNTYVSCKMKYSNSFNKKEEKTNTNASFNYLT